MLGNGPGKAGSFVPRPAVPVATMALLCWAASLSSLASLSFCSAGDPAPPGAWEPGNGNPGMAGGGGGGATWPGCPLSSIKIQTQMQ